MHTLFNTQDNTVATTYGDASRSSVRYTRIHLLFKTKDNTDATADGDTSRSSVGYKHTFTLSLILKIIPTPRQLEIHHVHQSGTHTHKHSLFITQDKTDAAADSDTSCSSVRYTHIHSLFITQDNADATADGDTSCSSVRYTHSYTLSLLLRIIPTPRQVEIHHVLQSGTHTHTHTHTLSLHYSR